MRKCYIPDSFINLFLNDFETFTQKYSLDVNQNLQLQKLRTAYQKILCSQFLTNWLENTDKILLAPIREAFQQSESNVLQLNQIKDLDRNIKLVEQRFEKLWKDISKFF